MTTLTRADLPAVLTAAGVEQMHLGPDRKQSISSNVIRLVHAGRLAVAVGGEASVETQIGALLDLVHLQLTSHQQTAPSPKDGAGAELPRVTLILGASEVLTPKVLPAVATLIGALRDVHVDVLVAHPDGLAPAILQVPDFSSAANYPGWADLLGQVQPEPPVLLARVQDAARLPGLRAYPQLTGHPWWSLRLDGLEVGVFRGGPQPEGRLNVGKVGSRGGSSAARSVWTSVAGSSEVRLNASDDSVAHAGTLLKKFIAAYATGATGTLQNEHALESRILAGECQVTADGHALQRVRADERVNWGSQFPTRWDTTTARAGRYLDAILRDEDIPWAVEMKVAGPAGRGGYYRHAVGQAVLYRHFIRSSRPLAPWFHNLGLDPERCRAAVVVPALKDPSVLDRVCRAFDVFLAQVPPDAALLHRLPAAT